MSRSNGFTLFELMIVIAVIGIVSAIAVPAYNSYIETANMTKTTALFQEAIKNAQTTFTKDEARLALGLPVTAPVDTQGWVDYFAETAESAPGGGPAFIESTNNTTSGRGDRTTGAIGVRYQEARPAKTRKNGSIRPSREARLELWRPMYNELREQRARISPTGVEITLQRRP